MATASSTSSSGAGHRARAGFYESVFGWSFRDADAGIRISDDGERRTGGRDLRSSRASRARSSTSSRRTSTAAPSPRPGRRGRRQAADPGRLVCPLQGHREQLVLALPAGRLRPAAQRLTVSAFGGKAAGAPVAPGARVELGVRTTGAGEPQEVDARGNAGAAVDDELLHVQGSSGISPSPVYGRLRAPGMRPATGSTGSTSPRYRSGRARPPRRDRRRRAAPRAPPR